jgi:CDP-paratose 2-epimerase
MTERILITGGAGFVGSNLALSFKRDRPSATIMAFDNLKRRGSELLISRLREGGRGIHSRRYPQYGRSC